MVKLAERPACIKHKGLAVVTFVMLPAPSRAGAMRGSESWGMQGVHRDPHVLVFEVGADRQGDEFPR